MGAMQGLIWRDDGGLWSQSAHEYAAFSNFLGQLREDPKITSILSSQLTNPPRIVATFGTRLPQRSLMFLRATLRSLLW